jgi:catechol 2,3-dioxygenase-like lactoylglutathione lyase family enzyme
VLEGATPIAFVSTTDPERARTFYGDTLGLRFVADEGFALVFDLAGTMLRVTRVDQFSPQPFTVLGWRVDDPEAVVRELASRGVAFDRYPNLEQDTLGIHPGSGVFTASALAIEVLFTTALVLVVLNVAATRATHGNSFYGLAIGFTILTAAFAGGPISGGAFNPAVGFGATLGAALFSGGPWSDLWLYLVGPLAGGAVAAGIHWFQMASTEALEPTPES